MPMIGEKYWALMIHQDRRDRFYPDGLVVLPWQGTLHLEVDCARLVQEPERERNGKICGQYLCIDDVNNVSAWIYETEPQARAAWAQLNLLAAQRIVELGNTLRQKTAAWFPLQHPKI